MAIVLKYGAPGPILGASYAAGVGSRQNKNRDSALERWHRQQLLAQQQGFQASQNFLARQQTADLAKIGREFQAAQQDKAMKFQGEQAGLGREFQAAQQKGVLDARAAESDMDRKQRLIEQKNQQEFIADQNIMEGVRRGELELPPEAQQKLRELEGGRVAATKLDAAGQAEFQARYDTEKRALLRLAQPIRDVPYDERVKKGLGANYEQFKNLPWQFNSQGEMGLPSGFRMPGEDQGRAAQEIRDGIVKRYEKLRGAKDEDTGDPISDEEAQRRAVAEQMQVEQFRQRISGGGATVTPEAAPSGGGIDPRMEAAYENMQRGIGSGWRQWTIGDDKSGVMEGSSSIADDWRLKWSGNQGLRVAPQGKYAGPGVSQDAGVSPQTMQAAKKMGYVQVRTPAEAMALPPGTNWVNPEGKTGTRP